VRPTAKEEKKVEEANNFLRFRCEIINSRRVFFAIKHTHHFQRYRVISVFNRANPFSGFALFDFIDICNQHELISGCVTGKISVINHTPPFHQFLTSTNATI